MFNSFDSNNFSRKITDPSIHKPLNFFSKLPIIVLGTRAHLNGSILFSNQLISLGKLKENLAKLCHTVWAKFVFFALQSSLNDF